MKDPQDYNVRAVERALQIMGCFDDKHPERGISEIAGDLVINTQAISRRMGWSE